MRPSRAVQAPDQAPTPQLAWRGLLVLALVAVAVHVVVNRVSVYGLHRDELLYLAMGRHLQLWSMDFPPWMALIAEITRALAGDTDVAIRLGPALAHGALVGLAGVFARDLHGGWGPQLLAAVAVLTAPVFLRAGHLFQPVVFDQLWWSLALLALLRIGRTRYDAAPDAAGATRAPLGQVGESSWTTPGGRRRRVPWRQRASAWTSHATSSPWFLLGVAGGLGLLTKFSIGFLGVGVLAALILGPLRRTLSTPRPWLALLTALVIGAPSLVGQLRLAWPVVSQLQDLRSTQLVHVGVGDFLVGQLLMNGPAVVLALLGVASLLRSRWTATARSAGLACAVAFVLLLVLRAKPYYAAPIYPLLFAAGAVVLARGVRRWRLRHGSVRWRVGAAGAVLVASAVATLPVVLPLLPPAATARWASRLGIAEATRTNTGGSLAIPQDFADMLGWPELAVAVSGAYEALPPAMRADVAIVAGNYGEAGALDFYGPRLGLPGVVSQAGSYAFFGPGDRVGDPLLTVGIPESTLSSRCARVTPLGAVTQPDSVWLVPEERAVRLFLCEQPTPSLRAGWERSGQ